MKTLILFLLKCKITFLLLFSVSVIYAQTNCGVDTVNYTYSKTTTFRPVSLNTSTSGNSFAQWFPTPQAITIEGFDFYAWQSAGTDDTVALTCNLFRAGADSLPFGAALRTVTVKVDSSFGTGVLTDLIKRAVFSSPITMTTPYIITVENSTSTNVSVLANDYAATSPNGRGEWLSSVRIGINYNRGYDINVGGVTFDADFIFRPHVKYTIESDFSFVGCNSGGNAINFTNKSSEVINSRFYNRYAFFNITRLCYRWDYGDTSGFTYEINGSKRYTHRVDHDVTLYDTLYGWFKGCAHSKTKTVFATPNKPTAQSSGPVCSGDSLKLYVDTLPNTSYVWNGPKGYKTNTPDTVFINSDTSQNGIYSVAAIRNGCPSSGTNIQVVINQTPQKPVASNDGSKCVGDDSKFKITAPNSTLNYHWSGPNGFTSNATSFDFNSVDTLLRGDYIVFVEDGLCQSEPDTVNLFIYPPPQPPVITAKNDSVCEGDTLFLIGNSVPGAIFNWNGPNGFFSTATNPEIKNAINNQAGLYTAKVIIGSCSSTSDSVFVGVNPKPTASVTANNTVFCLGDSATISATASTGLSYQWQKDSINIPNAVAENYVAKTDGNYRVIVTNTYMCSDISQNTGITTKPLPIISLQPTTELAKKDWDVTFTVNSPDGGVAYQWQEDKGSGFTDLTNTATYAGVTTNTLTVNNVDDNFNQYKYRCKLNLLGCETISNDGVLTINVNIKKLSASSSVKVFPNPTNSILNIDLELSNAQEVNYTVGDILGRVYITKQTFMANSAQQHTIDVSNLPKGIYFLKLEADGIEKIARFVVE